jgi:hypothetical protein
MSWDGLFILIEILNFLLSSTGLKKLSQKMQQNSEHDTYKE